MPTKDEYLNGWRDEYYRVVMTCREARGNWIARATVRRIDTDESVGGQQRSGKSREIALNLVVEKLNNFVDSFPRPPAEWGRVALRQLLVDYEEFKYKLTLALDELEKLRSAETLSASDLQQFYNKNIDFVIENTVAFAQRLQNLSEQDRIDLMTSPEHVYQNLMTPWNFDDRVSRSEIFKFIINPSSEVIRANEIHDNRKTI